MAPNGSSIPGMIRRTVGLRSPVLDSIRADQRPASPRPDLRRLIHIASPNVPRPRSRVHYRNDQPDRGGWSDGGFSGPGGGWFDGAGATGYWVDAEPRPLLKAGMITKPAGQAVGSVVGAPASVSEHVRSVVANGYTFLIDDRRGMIKAAGNLSQTNTPARSRKAQATAGGADRRPTDDGGHYIAARFNGPSDAFNHFAQDANFNRGLYRRLEDQWATALRAHKKVTVSIVPHYETPSKRPYEIDVSFLVDGHKESFKFPNERGGYIHGKH